jgi:hypothetical protein
MEPLSYERLSDHAGKAGVKQWQQFLQTVDDKSAASQGVLADGYFGPRTQQATCDFQRAHNLEPTGVVDAKTLHQAEKVAAGKSGEVALEAVRKAGSPEREFEIGPDKTTDLRECRPYFLVPMLELATPEIHQRIIERINAAATAADKAGKPVTDVFVISHGWHRNFFDAVAAYDRLLSRFVLLKHRDRLQGGNTVNPLLVCLHWHSDPGQDNWVDPAGRRSKSDFVSSACAKFDLLPNSTRIITNDFEDIFQFFSEISAPGIRPFDLLFDERAREYLGWLNEYALHEASDATVSEKATVLWRCFQESTPRKPVNDQDERPGRFRSLLHAVLSVINFAVSALGVAALAGLLFRVLPPASGWWGVRTIFRWWGALQDTAHGLAAPYGGLVGWLVYNGAMAGFTVAVLAAASVIGWFYLRLAASRTRDRGGRAGGHTPYPAIIAWLPMQLLLIAPALLFLFVTMLFGRLLSVFTKDGRVPGLYDERDGLRDQSDPTPAASPRIRWGLFELGRIPVRLLRDAVGATSKVQALGSSLDKQLAFLEMQVKGVSTGREAGGLIAEIVEKAPLLANARFHLVGHSFGCLVVANLVRRLALDSVVRQRFRTHVAGKQVASVCMLEAALASNWFEGEPRVKEMVSGVISSIYSRYDSATGFFYPVANNSRLAAGSVGMYGGSTFTAELRSHFVILVTTPNLDDKQFGGTGAIRAAHSSPRIFNLDASRMVYSGPVTSGGAHTDIFKEDVIQLCWAATWPRSCPPIEGIAVVETAATKKPAKTEA